MKKGNITAISKFLIKDLHKAIRKPKSLAGYTKTVCLARLSTVRIFVAAITVMPNNALPGVAQPNLNSDVPRNQYTYE